MREHRERKICKELSPITYTSREQKYWVLNSSRLPPEFSSFLIDTRPCYVGQAGFQSDAADFKADAAASAVLPHRFQAHAITEPLLLTAEGFTK